MTIDGFERPCCQVRLIWFLVVPVLDDAAELIVSDDFVKLPISHFDEESNPLVIGSAVILNLSCK